MHPLRHLLGGVAVSVGLCSAALKNSAFLRPPSIKDRDSWDQVLQPEARLGSPGKQQAVPRIHLISMGLMGVKLS